MSTNAATCPPPVAERASPWSAAAYVYAALLGAVLAYFLFGLTVQVSDSFGNLLEVQHASVSHVMYHQGIARGYLRPFLWAEIKLLYELADGRYFLWFRSVHVVQVLVLLLLCVRLMRPRTPTDAALVPGALAILVGGHTFLPTILEAFPINSFLTMMVLCMAAANVALEPVSRWWTDVAVCALLAIGALTVESGLLIWVVCVAAWILGARGVSRSALAVMTVLVVAYGVYRFAGAGIGGPGLSERASGFGFHVLEPSEIVRRFGAHPARFYAYNVAASLLTVLFSEPRAGVYWFTYEATAGRFDVWTVVCVLSSLAATSTLGWYLWTRRDALRRRVLDRDDRVVLLFGAVLLANAVVSYPYTKDVIMSPAGVFLAPAVFAASRRLVAQAGIVAGLTACVLVLVVNGGSAFREIGTCVALRRGAVEQRNTWAHIDEWLTLQQLPLTDHDARRLRDRLQGDAVFSHPTPPQPLGAWTAWFGVP